MIYVHKLDHAQKGKASAEKLSKQLEQQLNDVQIKLDESVKQINEVSSQKSKLTQ